VKVVEPHGIFTKKVEELHEAGVLDIRALRTMRKARRTAEDYLRQVSNIEPALKALRDDPSCLYSPKMTKEGVEATLADWGCKFAKQIHVRAKSPSSSQPTRRRASTSDFSITKFRRIEGLFESIARTAMKATPPENDAFLTECLMLLRRLQYYLEIPSENWPPTDHYQI
jgi:hypothetical protein